MEWIRSRDFAGLRGAESSGLDDVQEAPVLLQMRLGIEKYRTVELVQLHGVQRRYAAAQWITVLYGFAHTRSKTEQSAR